MLIFLKMGLVVMALWYLLDFAIWFFTGDTWMDAYDEMAGRPTRRTLDASPYARLKKFLGLGLRQ